MYTKSEYKLLLMVCVYSWGLWGVASVNTVDRGGSSEA